ncbi:hypothetical protein LGQ03_05415 [Loktanella sp. TSTF-M6]|uniref:Major facilitator superfamily (MFS) profile domain-containing protein n=1 Tax=Loktanella gaetbuli TaxID=2881335 RepID=A0ABS8BSI2_9RHOB|nr:hypothetical protein [Loktanella gaetbuli]MCB5198671.1 hypothetical protein [Loktanella gaetbuli]
MSLTRSFVVAIIAGIIGTIVNAIAVNIISGADVMPLIISFGRNAVAVVVALLLIPLFHRIGGTVAFVAGLVLLTVLPSVLAVYVFAAQAPWSIILGVNLVYALTATIIFAACYRSKR